MPSENFYPFTTHTAGTYNSFTACCTNKSQDFLPGSPARSGTLIGDSSKYNFWGTYQTWGYQEIKINWPDGPIGVFSSMTASTRHGHTNGGNTSRNVGFSAGAGGPGAVYHGVQDSSAQTTYGPITVTTAMNQGGIPWTAAHVTRGSASERWFFCWCYPDANAAARGDFASGWGVLTYLPPAGGFTFLLGLSALLVLPSIEVLQKLMAHRTATSPRQTKWLPGELQTAWRELRERTWPTYFHMGGLDAYTGCAVG